MPAHDRPNRTSRESDRLKGTSTRLALRASNSALGIPIAPLIHDSPEARDKLAQCRACYERPALVRLYDTQTRDQQFQTIDRRPDRGLPNYSQRSVLMTVN
jgi:hypothetical protein